MSEHKDKNRCDNRSKNKDINVNLSDKEKTFQYKNFEGHNC